jgi:hypothetical protein
MLQFAPAMLAYVVWGDVRAELAKNFRKIWKTLIL